MTTKFMDGVRSRTKMAIDTIIAPATKVSGTPICRQEVIGPIDHFGLSYTSSEIVREPLRSTNISFENFKEASRTRCSRGSGICRAIIDVQVISKHSEQNGIWRLELKWFGESHIASVWLKRSYRNSDYCDCVLGWDRRAGRVNNYGTKKK